MAKKKTKVSKRKIRSNTGRVEKPRTVEDTTIADVLRAVCPPREDTTGCHLVQAGVAYLLVVQGPEARHLTAQILTFVEALQEQSEVALARARDE